jgi:hypothetical protein
MDGVVEQQDNYKKSGFRYAYRNIRFEGIKPQSYGSVQPDLTALTSLEFDLVNAYDRTCFAEERPDFLRRWIGQPGAFGFGIQAGDRLGMSVVFETARMYTAKPPCLPLQHIFGVTTFELG